MNKIKFENDSLILTLNNDVIEVYKQTKIPMYSVGSVFIDYKDIRYFLISKK